MHGARHFAVDELLPVHDWVRAVSHADRELLAHCRGATLDIGCGPGRMSAHLAERGHVVLGVDIVREAVEQARRRGVSALRRNVFDPLPGEGRWNTVLLADGNIGIGGAPVRLLRRAVELLDLTGRVVCDLAAPGTGLRHHDARLVTDRKRSGSFPWAQVGPDAIEDAGRRRRAARGPSRRAPRPLVRGAVAMRRARPTRRAADWCTGHRTSGGR